MLTHLRSLTLVPVLLALIATPAAGPALGQMEVVKRFGYGLRPIEHWKTMAVQPGEKFIVGQWNPEMADMMKRGDYSAMGAELSIVRVIVPQATTSSAGEDEAQKKADKEKEDAEKERAKVILGGDYEKRTNPRTIDDWLLGHFEDADKRWSEKPMRAGKLKGKLREFTSGMSAYLIGTFKQDNVEWGVIYSCSEEYYRRNWKDIFRKSISTFRLFEPEEPTIRKEGEPEVDPTELKGDAKREYLKQAIAGSPGWYSIDTKNYVFLSNAKDKGFVKTLARNIEVLRAKVYEKLFPPQKEIDAISVVRVLDSQSEYYQYGGSPGSAGYWNSSLEELVLFDGFEGVTKRDSKRFTQAVMNHEAFHQYIHYAVGDLAPHSWFNEGHGDYFAGMVVSGGGVSTGTFDWRTNYLKQHLRDKKGLIPIRSLVRLPQREYYSNAGLKYSQGWALIFFLRKVTNDKRYREIPDIYFKYLSENIAAFRQKQEEDGNGGGSSDVPGLPGMKFVSFEDSEKVDQILSAAVDKAFEGVDFEQLDREFVTWVNTL